MRISVVMAVYNGEQYVEQSIRSILKQTYTDFELIVVDDGSSDQTWTILEQLSDSRIRRFRLSQNGGAAKALNLAVQYATGEWIAIHDADDLSHPERLSIQVEYVRCNPKLVAVGTQIACFGDRNIPPARLYKVERALNQPEKKLYSDRYSICPLCHGTALISKTKFLQAGGYDPLYKVTYDYDLWLKLFQLGPIGKVSRALYRYRIHTHSLSQKNGNTTYIEKLLCCVRRLAQFDLPQRAKPPRLIILGNEKLCRLMMKSVVSHCPVQIHSYIHNRIETHADSICQLTRQGEIDGIIQLHHKERKSMTQHLLQKGLVLNRNLFNL
ncbi:MAG: glycosyl transferase family 2 [Paenibacillus sp.]|jgi:glycosyltransferase involved in cell wall biosynthesis|nr:glycosyl transferase family 2 [Paenibacillus sp.]